MCPGTVILAGQFNEYTEFKQLDQGFSFKSV